MRRRRYTAAPDDERCCETVTLRDGSKARCMKRKAAHPDVMFCVQHARRRGVLDWAAATLVVLLLSADGWGCAGRADYDPCAAELDGWSCDETCGTCECDGVVSGSGPDSLGVCLEGT